MRRGARDGLLDAGRETTDASLVSHLTPPRVSCLASLATWKKAKLIELCKFQRGFDISKKEQRAGTIPVISSSGITSFHDTAKCKGPGVLVGRKGTLGTVHYCEGPYWPHSTALWVKDFKGNEPRFVYYFLKTLSFEHYDVGNANPTLNRNHVHLLDITIPPLSEQRRIVGILSAYDDLIENNRKRIALLEESARSLYKEWFVRLRFPGHERVPVEDGVPKGWKRAMVGELCVSVRDAANPKRIEEGMPYIGLEHMPRRSITLSEWGTADDVASGKLRFKKGEILFGKIRPYFHKVGIALVDGVASSDAIVIRPNAEELLPFVLLAVSSDAFIAATAQGMREGSKMPRADWKQMQQYPLSLPPKDTLASFNEIVFPVLCQCATLARQSRALAAARDALLQRLMKGDN